MNVMKVMSKWAMLCAIVAMCSGCTIIRYVEGNNDDNGGEPDPLPPKVVDMLLMVELDRTTVQLAPDYQLILESMRAGLAKNGVTVRKLAVAPMYRRAGNSVPLIYGEGSEGSEFASFEEAIGFFALDDGQMYLRDRVDSEGENLAAVGLNLDTASVYNPTTASPDNSAYFTTPADGFIVVQMTAKARSCSYNDATCKFEGKPTGEYFTQDSWLTLGGTGLPKNRVFFVSVATQEGVDEESFVKRCERRVGFDPNNLDSMEPSAHVYYEDFSEAVSQNGSWGDFIDMCNAMSLAGAARMIAMGNNIGKKLNNR